MTTPLDTTIQVLKMAQAPSKGIEFTVAGKHHVFGTMDTGDYEAVILAVEKGAGIADYSWLYQQEIYLKEGQSIEDFTVNCVDVANEVLESLYGKVDKPETDMEKIQALIMSSVTYDASENKLKF